MHRASRRPSTFLLGAGFLALVLVGTGCTGAAKNKLLVAQGDATEQGFPIHAVEPGDDLEDANLVIGAATRPNGVATVLDDGATWFNGLGRDWKNTALLSYTTASGQRLDTVEPGSDATTLATSPSVRSSVIRRGVFVETADGCALATDATATDQVGTGTCSISSDERWIASWGEENGLTIRDLRHDDEVVVDDIGTVTNAVALAADARVFAVVETDAGLQGVVLDATDGSEIGRTEVSTFVGVAPADEGATGFVVLTTPDGQAYSMSYVDTDAEVTEIDDSVSLIPINTGHEIVYLNYGEDLSAGSVRSWSPGDDEPETLLEGQVGAGVVHEKVVAIREVAATGDSGPTVEFWRPGAGHKMTRVLTIPAPADAAPINETGLGASVSKVWVAHETAYLQLDHQASSSFVRIDLIGDHSDAPVKNTAGLALESLDVDGTALLTMPGGDGQDVVVVGPHSEEPVTRGTFAQTGVNLIHEGVIYVTVVEGSAEDQQMSVRSIRSTGTPRPALLWDSSQLAGATWPEQNGATSSLITTVGALVAAAQTQQDQQAQGQQQVTGG